MRLTDPTTARIWAWLPGRATRARVTLPGTIAAALDLDESTVMSALTVMAAAGHVVRNRGTGVRASGWHRGRPLPAPPDPGEESTPWP